MKHYDILKIHHIEFEEFLAALHLIVIARKPVFVVFVISIY